VLTAISLDKRSITTATFRDPAAIPAWLEQYGKNRNIYFSVNPCRYDVVKKPMREDVKCLSWLHVDIDPRAGENLDDERKRALSLLQNPPQGLPKPTVIVFSGGGYQGFWKLLEPMDINGEEAMYQAGARYNQALELAFGADECHNVDRIMRLPGTINRPDERKKKKGRTEALAELIEWNESRIYALSQFLQAPAVQMDVKGFTQATTVQISGNIKRIDDVNDLKGISDLCKIVIVQGTDPDNPGRFLSRSEALFFVCCDMVRADLDNDTIYSVITDPDFSISASILDKGRNTEGYAKKQIERARERAIDPHLVEMNDKYAVVSYGGKMRVIYEDFDEILERDRLIKMTFEDFCRKYMNQRVQIGTDAQGNPRHEPLGQWWLKHEKRRQYEKITFAPGRETPNSYNMWRGFAFEPIAGDRHQLLLDHIRDNVCGSDQLLYDYTIGWMAWAVQHPAEPGQTALVLRGDMGVGKGFLARTFGKLFGRHFIHVSNAQHLTGNFNAHLRDCAVLFADEAFFAGDRRHASTLKALVTEDSIMVEPKGVDAEAVPNCLHILMASNEEWVVPAGIKERRFCVLDVGSKRIQDAAYFGRIAEAMRTGGYASLLHFLMAYDISNFDVRAIPQTKALQDQKVQSYESTHDWWYNKLREGKVLQEHGSWQLNVPVELLTADFILYLRMWGQYARKTSATKLGQFLRTACPGDDLRRWQSRDSIAVGDQLIQRPYYYTFPPLTDLRRHWDEKFGGPYNWPPVEGPGEEKPPF
jgi:hypothetical protein